MVYSPRGCKELDMTEQLSKQASIVIVQSLLMKCPSPRRGVRMMGEAVSFSFVVQPIFASLLLSASIYSKAFFK